MLTKLRHLAALILAFAPTSGANVGPAASTTVIARTAVTIPGITATLRAPSRVRAGDSITIRLVLRNDTNAAIMLPMTLGEGFGFDPVVRDAKGVLVWRRLAGQYVFADGEARIIQPHRTTEYESSWNLRDVSGALLPPGRYRLTGRLMDGGESVFLSIDADLVITP